MAKRGRKTKLTPELQAAIVKSITVAGTLEDTAAMHGIDRSTLFKWRAAGQAQKSGKFRDFFDATERAIRERDVLRERKLVDHGSKKDWRALAWLMERTNPKKYAPRVTVHVREELDRAVDRLCEAFKSEPEVLERALDALCGGDRSGEAEPAEGTESGEDDRDGEAVRADPPERKATPLPESGR